MSTAAAPGCCILNPVQDMLAVLADIGHACWRRPILTLRAVALALRVGLALLTGRPVGLAGHRAQSLLMEVMQRKPLLRR